MSNELNLALRIKADVQSALAGVGQFKNRLGELKDSVFNLRTAFASVGVGLFVNHIVEANIQMQRILFTLQAATGSAADAGKEFAYISDLSRQLGLDLSSAAAGYARLSVSARGAGISAQEVHKGFTGLAEALSVLHAPADEVNRILVQLDQAFSLGRVQMQDLRYISNSLPSVFADLDAAFRGTGKSINQMLQDGGIPAEEFFHRFTDYLHQKYGPIAVESAQSMQAELNKLHTALFTLYNDLADSAPFDFFKAAVQTVVDKLGDNEAQIKKTAQHLGQEVVDLAKGFALGTAATIDALAPAMKDVRSVVNGFIQTWNNLPAWVQDVGIVGAIWFGRKFTIAAAAVLGISKELGDWLDKHVANLGEVHLPGGKKSIIEMLTGTPADNQTASQRVQAIIDDLQRKVDSARIAQAAAAARDKGGAPLAPPAGANLGGEAYGQAQADKLKQQLQDMGQAVTQAVDPYAALNAQLEKFQGLKAQGVLTQQAFNAAFDDAISKLPDVQKHFQQTGKTMNQFAVQAARSIQSSFANFLFDPFKHGLNGMLTSFADTMRQMVAQIAAQQILRSVFSSLPTSWVNNLGLQSFVGTMKSHSGGIVGAGGSSRGRVSPLAFLGAPRYHTGGIVGLQPNEVPIIAQKGETILPNGYQPPAMGVQVINYTGQPAQTRQQQVNGRSIEQVIIGTVAEDVARGGQTWRAIAGKGGLKPKASGIG